MCLFECTLRSAATVAQDYLMMVMMMMNYCSIVLLRAANDFGYERNTLSGVPCGRSPPSNIYYISLCTVSNGISL